MGVRSGVLHLGLFFFLAPVAVANDPPRGAVHSMIIRLGAGGSFAGIQDAAIQITDWIMDNNRESEFHGPKLAIVRKPSQNEAVMSVFITPALAQDLMQAFEGEVTSARMLPGSLLRPIPPASPPSSSPDQQSAFEHSPPIDLTANPKLSPRQFLGLPPFGIQSLNDIPGLIDSALLAIDLFDATEVWKDVLRYRFHVAIAYAIDQGVFGDREWASKQFANLGTQDTSSEPLQFELTLKPSQTKSPRWVFERGQAILYLPAATYPFWDSKSLSSPDSIVEWFRHHYPGGLWLRFPEISRETDSLVLMDPRTSPMIPTKLSSIEVWSPPYRPPSHRLWRFERGSGEILFERLAEPPTAGCPQTLIGFEDLSPPAPSGPLDPI